MNRISVATPCCAFLLLAAPVALASETAALVAPEKALLAKVEDAGTSSGAPGAAQRGAAVARVPAKEDEADDAAEVDTPDEPAIEKEKQAESAELEQIRAAEEKARLPEAVVPEDPAARAASKLGLESPFRQRLRGAFGRETGPVPETSGRIALIPELDIDLRRLQAEYDIPIDVNEQVAAYIRFFQTPIVRKHFVKWLGRSSRYIPVFKRILREEGLPEDTVYLAMIESGFANLATSRASAVGPWQFISATGRRMGLKQDFWVDERRDPEKAAHAAARYLKELYQQTGDWRLAWAGYNAGVGKIFKARRQGQMDFWTMTRGKVLKGETKGYVPKLMACAIIAKHYESFGFSKGEIDPEQWQEYEEVEIDHAVPLTAVAEAAGISQKALLDLNPELRRTCTPPKSYKIKLPRGQAEVFAQKWPAVSEATEKLAFTQHHVSRGESLRMIASRYHVAQASLIRMNGLRSVRRVKPGTDLVIPLSALSQAHGAALASAERSSAEDRSSAPVVKAKSKRARRQEAREARRAALAMREATRASARESSRSTRVAAASAAKASRQARATVRVRAGDSLASIAQRFGVAVKEICHWNGIRNPRRFKLQVGRALVVYPRGEALMKPPASSVRAG